MRNNFEAPNSDDYGWDSKGMVEWVHNPFPNEMKMITKCGSEREESNGIVRLTHESI